MTMLIFVYKMFIYIYISKNIYYYNYNTLSNYITQLLS